MTASANWPVEKRLAAQNLDIERTLMSDLRRAVPAAAQTFWDMTIAGYWAWSVWDPLDGEFDEKLANNRSGAAPARKRGTRR